MPEYVLFENNRIVNDDSEACDIFNSHFASIGNDVGGNDCIQIDKSIDVINKDFASHSSITKIKEHVQTNGLPPFEFTPVSSNDVHKELIALNERKPSGYDSLPPKLLKLGKDALTPHITTLVNMSIQQNVYFLIVWKMQNSLQFSREMIPWIRQILGL